MREWREVSTPIFTRTRKNEDSIARAIDLVEQFVADPEIVLSSPQRPFQANARSDRTRLQRLLGRRVEENESSEDGFVNRDRLDRLRRRRDRTS